MALLNPIEIEASGTVCPQARRPSKSRLTRGANRLEQLAAAHARGELLVGEPAAAGSHVVVYDVRDVAAAVLCHDGPFGV
jgi:hypothetical protein